MPKSKSGLFGGYATRDEQLKAQIKQQTGGARKASGSVEKDAETYFPKKKSIRKGGESSEEQALREAQEKAKAGLSEREKEILREMRKGK